MWIQVRSTNVHPLSGTVIGRRPSIHNTMSNRSNLCKGMTAKGVECCNYPNPSTPGFCIKHTKQYKQQITTHFNNNDTTKKKWNEDMFIHHASPGINHSLTDHMQQNMLLFLRKHGIDEHVAHLHKNIGCTYFTEPQCNLSTMSITTGYMFVLHNDPNKEAKIAAFHIYNNQHLN